MSAAPTRTRRACWSAPPSTVRTISIAFNDVSRARAGATGCRSFRRRGSASSACWPATRRAPDEVVAHVAPGFRRGDGRAHRDQRGDGGLPSRISAGADRRGRGDRRRANSICRAYRRPPIRRRCGSSSTARSRRRLGVNGGINCLGQGTWANATLGRALRLILQNIGGALPGDMDRATHGQPGKYTFCCAENEAAKSVGAVARRARLRADAKHGDRRRRGGHAQYEHARQGRRRSAARDRRQH